MPIARTITWFDSPADADAADRTHYAEMTPQERLNEMVELLDRWGNWHERRLDRVARIVDVPRG
jgi:hypothetical protein